MAEADRLAVAIAFDVSLERCLADSEARRDRRVPKGVVQRHHREMRAGLPPLNREAHAAIPVLHGTEIAQA
jgi:predicted kinase